MPPIKTKKDKRRIFVNIFVDLSHLEAWLEDFSADGMVDILNITPLPSGQGGGVMVIVRVTPV